MLPFIGTRNFYYIFNYIVAFVMEWVRRIQLFQVEQEVAGTMKYLQIKNLRKSFENLEVIRIFPGCRRRAGCCRYRAVRFRQVHLAAIATLLETMDSELIYLGEHAVWTDADGSGLCPCRKLRQIQRYYRLVFRTLIFSPTILSSRMLPMR